MQRRSLQSVLQGLFEQGITHGIAVSFYLYLVRFGITVKALDFSFGQKKRNIPEV